VLERTMALDSTLTLLPQYNQLGLGAAINDDIEFTGLVLFDHVTNDWRDVLQTKIDVPTAIFTEEYGD